MPPCGKIETNNNATAIATRKMVGMIDCNACHNGIATRTWSAPLEYVHVHVKNDTSEATPNDYREELKKYPSYSDLVMLNPCMYNTEKAHESKDFKSLSQIVQDIRVLLEKKKQIGLTDKESKRLSNLEKKEKTLRRKITDAYRKNIPSLVIVPTVDIEFAHIDGYKGMRIYQESNNRIFYKKHGQAQESVNSDGIQNWKTQIKYMEEAVVANPLRLLPLFSYDPRRYRLPNQKYPGDKGCEKWNQPFAHIVGYKDSDPDIKKIWLGFCMNPALGFRPLDEFCEHLPRFYRECEQNDIPILAHCAPGGITTHDAKYYTDDVDERIEKSQTRHGIISDPDDKLSIYDHADKDSDDNRVALCTKRYCGGESVVDYAYDGIDNFYMYYGHPRSWK